MPNTVSELLTKALPKITIPNSFGLKSGFAITALTVGLTTISVFCFYSIASQLVRNQITGRLRDIGHVAAFLFDETDRENIIKLKAAIDRDNQRLPKEIQQIKPGDTLKSLSPETSRYYHSTEAFKGLVQNLRKIGIASYTEPAPLRNYYPQLPFTTGEGRKRVLVYLLVTTPESPDRRVLKFLASGSPEPDNTGWQGNPIGNLYVPVTPLFARAFDGMIQIDDDYYTDSFYTSLTAAIPIKDLRGQTIAVLGLDYPAGTEQDKLGQLLNICISIVVASLILSVLLSLLIARHLGQPVKQLQIAAQKARSHNYAIAVDTSRRDELGVLARIFNEMIVDIRNYSTALEAKNTQLKDYAQNLEQIVQERTLALSEANQKLQELANLDGLTNIYNRRYFQECLEAEWQRAARSANWLSLILCDVDHFKIYNDTYGHQAGDECLRVVARALQQCLKRSGDFVARYGGEEFALILPNTGSDEAMAIAEQMSRAIRLLSIEHRTSPTDSIVTVSIGIASMIPEATQSLADLIEYADRALYQSKQRGRNCMSVLEVILSEGAETQLSRTYSLSIEH